MRAEDVLDSLCPHDWLRVRAKHVFANSTERARHDDTQLSASQRLGVVPQAYLMAEENQKYMLALSGTDNFKHVEIGDFIISLRSFEGGFEYSAYQGCVSPAYTVLRPRFEINSSYWKNLFKSSVFRQIIAAFNVGVRDGKSIRYDDFSDFILAIPPLALQTTISGFLDRETTRIDALIAKKTRFIELLREKRQALITQAVTKGLDPNVEMKDSGVEWLGQVPGHWEVSRLGFEAWVRARLGWKGLKAEEYVDEGFVFLATPNIKGKDIDFENVNYIDKIRFDESPEIKIQVGDVLLAKDGSTLGTVNVVRVLPRPATVNSSIAVITPYQALDGIYLFYLFQSTYLINTIQMIKGGMGVPHLFQADLNKFYIPLPPLETQKSIITHIDHETARIDALIETTQRSIDLLNERRSALITATVTGQIDVRETH